MSIPWVQKQSEDQKLSPKLEIIPSNYCRRPYGRAENTERKHKAHGD